MSKLTKLAEGRPCAVRLPGCDGGGPTTIAAHFRSQRLGAGMAKKPDDLFIAFCCGPCRDRVDKRNMVNDGEDVRHAFLMGVLETQKWLWDHGHIHCGKSL